MDKEAVVANVWSRKRRRTEVEKEKESHRGQLSAYRESKLCLAYARTNPSICASFLPWMATTSFQGRSRRDPPLPVRGMDFSRAPNSAPSINGPILFIGDRTRPVESIDVASEVVQLFHVCPSLTRTDSEGGFRSFVLIFHRRMRSEACDFG